jgi:Superinfection immunity protein
MKMTDGQTQVLLALAAVCVFSYFLPYIIARLRGHRRVRAIFWVNLLFGFTGVIWLVMFFWAIMGESQAEESRKLVQMARAVRS